MSRGKVAEMLIDVNASGNIGPPLGGRDTPADFSDDDEDPAANSLNKQALLEWLTVADFTKEISLTNIAGHKFKLDSDELEAMIGTEGILKICKV